MAEITKIQWCHHTFNPWIGCAKVSEGCAQCYAEALATRFGWTEWGQGKPRIKTSPAAWKQPLRWNRSCAHRGVRESVFPSMCDPFDEEVSDEWRSDLFQLIGQTPDLNWLLLTKRPQQAAQVMTWDPPFQNVWIGFSAENQRRFDERWPFVKHIPASVRFCSYEPALGELQLPDDCSGRLHWLICGGESGPKAREFPHLESVRNVKRQCSELHVAFFMKQLGTRWAKNNGGKDYKGGDPNEWPEDLRSREFPSPLITRP